MDKSSSELALEKFGYHFDEERLRDIQTNESFIYDIYNGDKAKNQKRYEEIGEIITDIVYGKLEQVGLQRIVVPLDGDENEPKSFFFASSDAWTNQRALVILIHGSGLVRAGQWARKLIINESLDAGSQLPYIEQCQKREFGVIVLNTNLNRIDEQPIRHNDNPKNHALYVWSEFVLRSKARYLVIVAHSAGGLVVLNIAECFETDFRHRVIAVCLTDSIHSTPEHQRATSRWWQHVQKTGRNWIVSCRPVGAREKIRSGAIGCVSAGTPIHEETSWKAINSIFELIDRRLARFDHEFRPPQTEPLEDNDNEQLEVNNDDDSEKITSDNNQYDHHDQPELLQEKPMQIPVQLTSDGLDEWVILELQGSVESASGNDLSGMEIGTLSYTKEGCPVLLIGHHALYGKEALIEKPFGVLVKRNHHENASISYDIVAIIRRKIVFKNRPKPIVTKVAKKV